MMTVKPIHRAKTVSAVREPVTRTLGVPAASYLDRLLMELDNIHEQFKIVLDASAIKNIDPNQSYSDLVIIGHPSWDWEA